MEPLSATGPLEEIRFGVVLNGGVSLAVWMGGAVLELERLVKSSARPDDDRTDADRPPDPVYAQLLDLAGCTARVDVISGTSAGGINGAALALAQVNRRARLELVREIWVDQGRIESLLRQPFKGAPTSLLKGDEYFLPRLNDGLSALADGVVTEGDFRSPVHAPMDLTITTTVLDGNQIVTTDDLGQSLPQTVHAGRFHWGRPDPGDDEDDPFEGTRIRRTADRLSLAARCTASFPVAFEPVFVPVGAPDYAEPEGVHLTEEQRLRPDMAGVVTQWGDGSGGQDRSRYAVDGGALANTPTREALEAIERLPADGPVRRIMLLVYPHAPSPGSQPGAEKIKPPTVLEAVGDLVGALTAQGSRTHVEELERHNRVAADRRGTRNDIVQDNERPGELADLVAAIYPQYKRLRIWRAGRDLAERMLTVQGEQLTQDAGPRPTFEQVRRAAESAQLKWDGDTTSPRSSRLAPFVSDTPPDPADRRLAGPWTAGISTALGVAEAAADLLRRLVWAALEPETYEALKAARMRVTETRTRLIKDRGTLLDDDWQTPRLAALHPDESYWALRLASYERRTNGAEPVTLIQNCIARVVQRETARRGAKAVEGLADHLWKVLVLDVVPESAGLTISTEVQAVLDALVDGPIVPLRVLDQLCGPDRPATVTEDDVKDLHAWRNVLMPGGTMPTRDELLTTLLQLEIASTTIGDEVRSGSTQPVELVQLSAQAQNAFTTYSRTGDDKLGGMSVNRFGGFLKTSWRVNDWTWGRCDAATVLCRTVLQPRRLRRRMRLAGRLAGVRTGAMTAGELADEVLAEMLAALFPNEPPFDPPDRRAALVAAARVELTQAFDVVENADEDLEVAMPGLADLFAWALHRTIVPEELPGLARAIAADRVQGANARSNGESFLQEYAGLLTELSSGRRPAVPTREAAMVAFDRAGIGREPLREEGSSDLMIRTATSAAAVGATLLDSARFGLAAVRPVTRAVRGTMLLPYWVVIGLTSKAVLARGLALLGLSIGATLLALSLFGVLPAGLTGPAAALGAGALLVAFTYGALRAGTMLHGLVLLTPVIPLLAYSVQQVKTGQDLDAERGISTLAAVLALGAALVVLGSLPAAGGSVLAATDHLALRLLGRRLLPVRGGTPLAVLLVRRVAAVVLLVLIIVAVIAVVVAVVAFAWWIGHDDWKSTGVRVADARAWLLPLTAALLIVSTLVAYVFGRQLRVLRKNPEGWSYLALADPGGNAAGWAVLYGALYLIPAEIMLFWHRQALEGDERLWLRALVLFAAVAGVVLLAVVPIALPVLSVRRARKAELARVPFLPVADIAADVSSEAYPHQLVARNVGYRWFFRNRAAQGPRLNRRGRRLLAGLNRRIGQRRPPGTPPAG